MEKKIVDSRKIVDIVLFALLAVFFIMVAIGVAMSDRVNVKVYEYGGNIGSGNVIIHSVNELKAAGIVNDNLTGRYDEKFFNKKSLIICNYSYTGAGVKYEVADVYKEGDAILVDLYHHGGSFLPQMVISGSFLIEVKKSLIEGVTKVEVKSLN